MAVNAYMIIEGRPGPSTSKTNATDILSFSFGVSNQATYGAGSSGSESRAGRANINDLTFMCVADKNLPLYFDDCATGNNLEKATLYYDKPMGDAQEDYFKIEMEDVVLTAVNMSGSSENPVVSISMAFEKVKVCYNPESDEGKLQGFIEKGFNLATLKPY
ncbi:MAG: type VI secretion system tube protein Hcp [Bryobacteraceae bacterium]|nr:type VI secretion system tube protein Hcp [Bryobacteraceae bacterium]